MESYLKLCAILACIFNCAFSIPNRSVTENPSLKGHSIIGPDPSFTCPSRGVFAHPVLCDYYYECWGSIAQLGYCTENQLFDLNYEGCNWPEYVECGDRHRPSGLPGTGTPPMTTQPTTTGQPPVGNFTCPTQFGAYPNEGACEYYWQCFDWESELVLCQNYFLFDIRYQGCNYDFLTACQDRPRPSWANTTITPPDWTTTPAVTPPTTTTVTTPTTTPGGTTTPVGTTTTPPGFVCPASDGSFADPADCQSFYICVGGDIVGHQTCPDGLMWNDALKNCDFAWNVDCPII